MTKREPTRICGRCNGNKTITEMVTTTTGSGKRIDRNRNKTCPDCGGQGVR